MPKTVDDVRIGVDGIIAIAPESSPAPTSATSKLPDVYKDLGFVSEDGLTETVEQNVQKLRAWQNSAIVRSVITEGEVTYKFTLLQTTAETIALYFGRTVQEDGSIVIDPMRQRERHALVFDIIDGDHIIRTYAPHAQVTALGEITYQNGSPIGYDITVTCIADNDIAGTGESGSVRKWFSSLEAPPGITAPAVGSAKK